MTTPGKCVVCNGDLPVQTGAGRPRRKHIECGGRVNPRKGQPADGVKKPDKPPRGGSGVTPPRFTQADPFNSTPVTAPLPPQADAAPGLLATSIKSELDALRTWHPMAATLKAVALQLAQAADAVPATDLKNKLLAIKNVRDVIKELASAQAPETEEDDDSIFGAVRPQVVNAPEV